MYNNFLKRIFDIFMALVAIIILLPLFIIVGFLVKVKLGSPIIFKQKRAGYKNKVFTMYKFRSMTNACDANGKLLCDEQRLTKFGKFLRNTSIDELPELFNILIGQMSFVGPRPLALYDVVFFNEKALKRLNVKPGLTGLAQINGRNIIKWEDKFDFDIIYMKKITFLKDILIIFKTVGLVLRQEDVTSAGMEVTESLGNYLLRTNQITRKEYDEKIRLVENFINDKPNVKYKKNDKITALVLAASNIS